MLIKGGDKVVHLHDAVDSVVAGKLIQPSACKIEKEKKRQEFHCCSC